MVPGALSIITQTFSESERGRAFGLWTSATSALALVGPLVGGLLVDTIGWRIAFLVNVPILAIALAITLRHVAESRDVDARRRFDWLGSLVAALAVGGLSFGVIRGGANEWQDAAAWIAIAIGAIALVAFPVLMATRPDPLVPLGLFRSRVFTTVNVATFFVYGGLYVMLSYLSITLQGALGYTRARCRRRGPADGDLPDHVVDPHRHARGPYRSATIPHPRARVDGARPVVVHATPGDLHPLASQRG